MISQEILDILVCPETHLRLRLAAADEIARLNEAIQAGRLINKAGQPVKERLDGGLVREDGVVVYPIMDDIPIMLIDEAIPLDQVQ